MLNDDIVVTLIVQWFACHQGVWRMQSHVIFLGFNYYTGLYIFIKFSIRLYFIFLFLLYVFQYYAIVMYLKGISMSSTWSIFHIFWTYFALLYFLLFDISWIKSQCSLQITPVCNLRLKALHGGGKVVIVNLQACFSFLAS